jgi:site-specific DNA-cytosine methylase
MQKHPGCRRVVVSPKSWERMMGFPRGWTRHFGLSRRRRLKMLGNAVVPDIAEWIGRSLLESRNP